MCMHLHFPKLNNIIIISTCGSFYGNIVSVSKKSGISKRTVFLKDGLAKYDISAG